MIVILILIALVVAANAILDAKMILKNKFINHTLEYGLFFIACLFLTFGTALVLDLHWSFGKCLLTAFWGSTLARIAFFNIINYYERGLKLDYESSQTTSIIDKLEHKTWAYIWQKFHVRIKDIYLSLFFIAIYVTIILIFV